MAVLELPVRGDVPNSQFACELEGVTYIFETRWNDRDESWYLSISTAEGSPIISGMRMVTEFPLGARSIDSRKWAGLLLARDTTGKLNGVPGRHDLGNAVKLLYFERSEFP